MVHIYFSNGSIEVDAEAVEAWFPELGAHLTWAEYNGEHLVDVIADTIAQQGLENISTVDIRNAFKQLFSAFAGGTVTSSQRQELVRGNLDAKLVEDMHSGAAWQGLKVCRQRFLILACLAGYGQSKPLARALASWFAGNNLIVSSQEDCHRLSSWGIALHKLQGLIHAPTLAQLANALKHPGPPAWDLPSVSMPFHYHPHPAMVLKALPESPRLDHYRGRGRHSRALVLPTWADRARSAPAYRLPARSPDWSVGYRLPRPSWGTPVTNQLALPARGGWADLEEVMYEQDLQAAEVDDLERRVSRLELTM